MRTKEMHMTGNWPKIIVAAGTCWLAVLAMSSKAYSSEPTDSVTAMCIDAGQTLEICSCASDALLSKIGDENYTYYEGVGKAYLEELADGSSRPEAWMTALDAEGAELKRTNEYGSSHRAEMIACSA